MSILEIVSIFIFIGSLSSFGLGIEQGRTPIQDRIGMFRSEELISIVVVLSFIFMVASAIILFLYSWVLLLVLFIGTAITYPLVGRFLLLQLLGRLFLKIIGEE